MEKARRDNLRRVVNKCRKIFEEEFAKRILYYGFTSDGQSIDASKLGHLSHHDIEIKKKLEQAIAKERLGGLNQKAALQRYIEHVGFTFTNRFAALRSMEVRSLIKETIARRDQFGGRSLRERDIWESNPSLTPDQVIRRSLVEAFEEVGKEIRVLFDNESEYSLLFPEMTACLKVMALFSENVTDEDWKQDDAIGWVYQYYNDEARSKFRSEKRKPQADDIPVINQFYTPDWIVKALVDNTLGRLWMEAHPNSRLKPYCNSLASTGAPQGEREVKPVREIKILDPACGSGHFLSYAFDLLYQMYREEEPGTPESEIPGLILEHNLYGIDIDLRAVQLAALSLFLKGKKYSSSLRIRKMNLICADVRISNGEKRIEFLRNFKGDEPLQQIFRSLFDNLGSTFEIGSLLKVRAPFEALFRERKETQGEKQAVFAVRLTGQTEIGEKGLRGQTELQGKNVDASDASLVMVVPKERTIEDMLDQLRRFERDASEAQDMGRLLFATEAEKSVGLLALLSQKYDVILMNPPYGDMPERTKKYLREYYPETHHDYYAAFMEQTADLVLSDGYVGALVGRTFMFLKYFQWVREVLFREKITPQLILDLGYGVLDNATARWAAYTAKKVTFATKEARNQPAISFVRLTEQSDEPRKRRAWEAVLESIGNDQLHPLFYKATLEELSYIPGTPFSYWTTKSLRSLFTQYPPLDRDVAHRPKQVKIADVKVGLQTGDDVRFTRMWWEVPIQLIATNRNETTHGKEWVPFANDVYLYYFFADLQTVVKWANDGREIREFPKSVIRNESFYFQPGLSWSVSLQRSQLAKVRHVHRIPFRILQSESIFGIAAHAILLDTDKAWKLLPICCSKLMYYLSRLVAPDKMAGTGSTATLPIPLAILRSNDTTKQLAQLGREAHDISKEWMTGEEESTLFIKPWILQALDGLASQDKPITGHPLASSFEWSKWPSGKAMREIKAEKAATLQALANSCIKREQMLRERLEELQNEIDEMVYQLYEIPEADRSLIENELNIEIEDNEEDSGAKGYGDKGDTRVRDLTENQVARLISYYTKRIIESAEDGIVPLDPGFPHNLLQGVRSLVSADFGTRVESIEKEIEDILGITLSEWIDTEFFEFHMGLYRRRPIFWQLTSAKFGHGEEKPAFSCFVYYHKLTHDTVAKIRGFYVKRVKEKLGLEGDRLRRELLNARQHADKAKVAKVSQDYELVVGRIEELEKFDQALERVFSPRNPIGSQTESTKWVETAVSEVRDRGWYPNLDYGVLVNIVPLREAQLLPPAAARVK